MTAFLARRARSRLVARALTLEDAAVHLEGAIPTPAAGPAVAPGKAAGRLGVEAAFYGEPEHRAVKGFVLEMSAALAQANAALRRQRLQAVAGPSSKAPMLEFLRKAQTEMQLRRANPLSRDG